MVKKIALEEKMKYVTICVLDGLFPLPLQVNCKSFTTDTKFKLRGQTLKQLLITTKNQEKHVSCCFNATHSLKQFGNCKLSSIHDLNPQISYYRNGTCNSFFQQEMASFRIHENCLQTIVHLADCKNVEIPISNTCRTVYCDDIF